MSLQLENISRAVDGVDYIRDANLTFEAGSFNVLLGRTLAGKTSLMRLMAGLDRPDTGRLLYNGDDVTGQSVRKRNISMIYQQFINYPNLSVYENIASPLRLARLKEGEIERRVRETAAMLRIEGLLGRYPLELSGGQQQRTAMARALVKDATLILFDEPLVNLDYKLREELRSELRHLFRERQCIAIYATSEANEALALGGTTTLLHEGRVVQTGPVSEVYRRPVDTLAAELFSEPPMNLLPGRVSETGLSFDQVADHALTRELKGLSPGDYIFGIRPSHASLRPAGEDDLEIPVTVELGEISGSATFLHVGTGQFDLVLEEPGVHQHRPGEKIRVYLPMNRLFVFGTDQQLVHTPADTGGLNG
ncbi:carbohydrate ABC transporter ATP-binding protein, CUT1 family [Marinobacter daqiaonensis]|uniref:Carbohydrate ABC transporter ATP-binding protein, CUT1 family n=1 Tax=Marinobacter daqiaonensis TaxID=650891 RepID=A0A1I6J5P5_9GAMM|nr:ABC transporter ATP-binding protein [Marinobacter daqiaonensis]SFR74259.1 carbohydrate ABC transporter ATP-binding protein, CUT1 family [Marinobacter daqiaonensis]